MNASKTIQYLDAQKQAIEALIQQLDEVQVAFNAQFDEWKTQHDAKLDKLTALVAARLDAAGSPLRSAIEARLPQEQQRLEERRQKIREQYLPQRQRAADGLLDKAQAELARLRELNPELDAQEEELKLEKARLENRLADLNEEIRQKSRGLGVLLHFVAITQADRERHRILGKLETVNPALQRVRREWEQKRKNAEERQAEYQNQWQLESIAVARLQAELDQLNDDARREDLALRRAIRAVLDDLKAPTPCPDAELEADLQRMVELNVQTDDYHAGLASVGGLIGLLRGLNSGLGAVRKSIDGIEREYQMHKAYLKAPSFSLPARVEAFHKQWPALAEQFADEKTIGQNPVQFSANVKPLLEGPLAQAEIERMFGEMGDMIKRATAHW